MSLSCSLLCSLDLLFPFVPSLHVLTAGLYLSPLFIKPCHVEK